MARKNASGPILKAAKHCLIEGGGRFEMLDVAKKAGVSEGLAYHYFKTKAGLIKAIVADFYQDYHAILNQPAKGDIPWDVREEERLVAVIDFMYQEPLAPIIFALMEGSKEVAEAEATFHKATVEMAVKNIITGQEQGRIPADIDASLMGAAILGAVRNSFAAALGASPRPSINHVKNQLWTTIARMVALPAK